MANNLDDIEVIRIHFFEDWNALYPAVPVVLDNEPPVNEPDASWARLSIQPGAERRRSIAHRTYEQFGRVYFQVFGSPNAVDVDMWPLAHRFADAFRDWLSPDFRIRFDTPSFELISAQDDEPAMLRVSIAYTAQH